MSVVMQGTIDLRSLSTPSLFAKKFGVKEEDVLAACDGDRNLLRNKMCAHADCHQVDFMSDEERVEFMCATIAERMKNRNAIDEYKKKKVYFGVIESILGSWSWANPLFERMTFFRTWSRWEKVLFLPEVPNLDDIFERNKK